MDIDIATEVFVVEYDSPEPLRREVLQTIERRVATQIGETAEKTLDKVQQMESDVLGWGRIVRAKLPHVWDSDTWPATFSSVSADINVKIIIRGAGGTL